MIHKLITDIIMRFISFIARLSHITTYKQEITIEKRDDALVVETPTERIDGSLKFVISLEDISKTIQKRRTNERNLFNPLHVLPTKADLTMRVPSRKCYKCGSNDPSYTVYAEFNSYYYSSKKQYPICENCINSIEEEIELYIQDNPEQIISYHL